MIEVSKNMSLMSMENKWQHDTHNMDYYEQWTYPSFRCWVDGTKIEKTAGKGFGA